LRKKRTGARPNLIESAATMRKVSRIIHQEFSKIGECSCHNSNANDEQEQHQGQPVSAAAARFAGKLFGERIFNQMFNN
jgi:hypothetical protein